jgi:hypothetical protein
MLMTLVGNVPNITGNIMPVCSWHISIIFLEAPFYPEIGLLRFKNTHFIALFFMFSITWFGPTPFVC